MSAPHDCPLPNNKMCHHDQSMTTMEVHLETNNRLLMDLKIDMKEVKASLAAIGLIEQKQKYSDEAMDRAFAEIRRLKEITESHQAVLNEFSGMKKLAIVLWSVLGSGVIAILAKLYHI